MNTITDRLMHVQHCTGTYVRRLYSCRRSYDPIRETFCILMEDLNLSGYTGGDQISGGPGKDEPGHLGSFVQVSKRLSMYDNVWSSIAYLGR